MSYTDRLMSTGERIIVRDRQHWFVVLAAGRLAIAAILIAIVILVVQATARLSEPVAGALGIVTLVLFVGGLVMLGWEILRYRAQEYIVTNRRAIQVSGVINKRSADSSLEKINDADLSQSLLGRMFNFGDLDILTAADAGIDRFRMIHDPVSFKRAMLDAKHEYEQDMSRGPAVVSPPLRAAAEVRAPERVERDPDATTSTPIPPAPAPAAAPPAPAHMSPDDVTRTLNSLADLRDRGAISPEEYEHKKAGLLGRL